MSLQDGAALGATLGDSYLGLQELLYREFSLRHPPSLQVGGGAVEGRQRPQFGASGRRGSAGGGTGCSASAWVTSRALTAPLCPTLPPRCPPSTQAAAVVLAARRQAGITPFWPSVLEELTGYREGAGEALAQALCELTGAAAAQYGSTVTSAAFA